MFTIHKYVVLLVIAVFWGSFAAGCSNRKADNAALTIAAAADLKYAFTEMGEEFSAKHKIPVTFSFGSTGQLTQQIANGAPVDIFSAADAASIEKLAGLGVVEKSSISKYAQGRIVLLSAENMSKPISSLQELSGEDIKKIAIANPEHAPYGLAAKEALETAGIWERVQDKIVYGQNVGDTMTLVESGNAEAGIVALSIADAGGLPYQLLDEKLHRPIIQSMGIVQSSKNKAAAEKFVQFVHSQAGRKIMTKYGFILPGDKNE